MEADFKGIWGQTWCGAGLWGGHGSFWGSACPHGAPAMLRPLLAQLGPSPAPLCRDRDPHR